MKKISQRQIVDVKIQEINNIINSMFLKINTSFSQPKVNISIILNQIKVESEVMKKEINKRLLEIKSLVPVSQPKVIQFNNDPAARSGIEVWKRNFDYNHACNCNVDRKISKRNSGG